MTVSVLIEMILRMIGYLLEVLQEKKRQLGCWVKIQSHVKYKMNILIYQAVLQNKKNEKAKEIKGDWTLRVGREDGTGRDPEVGFHFL